MKLLFQRKFRASLGLISVALVTSTSAFAHNEDVHQNMVAVAYAIMRGVDSGRLEVAPPAGVSSSEWSAFLNEMKAAVAKYQKQQSGLPAPKRATCKEPISGNNHDPGQGWSQQAMGSVPFPVSQDYATGTDCGVRINQTAGGWSANSWWQSINGADNTGNVIGYWTADIDHHLDDSHMWFRPTSFAGTSVVKKVMGDAFAAGVGSLLLPFVCLVDLFEGDPGKCLGQTKDIASQANVVDHLEGLIPGIGDWKSDMFVGMWHHVKLIGTTTNEFDDHEGYYTDDVLDGVNLTGPDPMDLAVIAGADTVGLSLNYDKSNGIHRYQIKSANDGLPDTVNRGKSEWQHLTFPHVPFEPVDNLGFFGWRNFRDNGQNMSDLGYPLHAIGDATVPMHVLGTGFMGHRPFEDAQDHLWNKLINNANGEPDADQQALAAEILVKAFNWRGLIISQRNSGNVGPKDVPVRALVTALASNTAQTSKQDQLLLGVWPFNPVLSTLYFPAKAIATDAYESFPGAVSLYQPILTDGIGATLAFLTSASEVLQ